MKTIKMVADELGVTKQTIVNNAKNLNISFKKENGINYINDNDCLKIIEKITKKESKTQNKESVKKELFNENTAEFEKKIYNSSNSSETLKTKVNELEKQIEIFEARAKNDEKYIENLTKQLDQQNSNVNTLNKLLENQQILALESNKKIQKLESKLEEEKQLNYSANKRQDIEVQETMNNMDSINSDPDNQKEKIVSQFSDESKDKHEDKQQDSESQQSDKIDGEQKEDIRNENHSKKSFWSRLFGN
ncbi:chromosome segregation ATPase [Staphylococcus caledonicus]